MAAVEGTEVSEVLDPSPTSTAVTGDAAPLDETQTSADLPRGPGELTPTSDTSGEGQPADKDTVKEDRIPTGLLIGGGLLLAAGLAGAYYWYHHRHEKNISES